MTLLSWFLFNHTQEILLVLVSRVCSSSTTSMNSCFFIHRNIMCTLTRIIRCMKLRVKLQWLIWSSVARFGFCCSVSEEEEPGELSNTSLWKHSDSEESTGKHIFWFLYSDSTDTARENTTAASTNVSTNTRYWYCELLLLLVIVTVVLLLLTAPVYFYC